MNIKNLFTLADSAKQIREYELANTIFALLAHHAITNPQSGIKFVYELSGDDIIENLANPHTSGYHDLPAVTYGNDCYLCIPIPLVNREFMNQFICSNPMVIERSYHDRNYQCGRLLFTQ